ncbi:MAG: XRE family transcriptional regulator, partial [Gemmatimonadetes bacterium]
MATDTGLTFGELLRRARQAAGLTQEVLAERAGLSVRGIADLERGARRAPYPDTVRRLAEALHLAAPDRAPLDAAGRRVGTALGGGRTPDLLATLPVPLTSFVGREHGVAEVRGLLGTTRLLTLTGPGGVGKTRLALRVAQAVVEVDEAPVAFVDLAPLADPAQVPAAVARVLGVREQPPRPLLDTLREALRPRRLLLVWDNCEYLLAASAELVDGLLRACPGLRLLATSREPLDVAGETTWPVPPLGVPNLPSLSAWERLAEESEAVRLFIERAGAARPDFELSERNAQAVAEVCVRLDGIPLAIELAAARVPVLTPEQLAARLDDRFRLLVGGSRSALPRQQTLRATVDWSYDLLAEPERRLFDRLSVFAGGWSLEAAEAVGAGDGVDPSGVLDLLGRLVAKSLVVADPGPEGAMRYRLLETIRAYGREKLHEAGEEAALGQRHLDWCLALAERAEPELLGRNQAAWLDRLETEHDNLRAALRWCLESGDGETGLRLAGALGRFWFVRGYLSEGSRWFEQLFALPSTMTAEDARAKALSAAGLLAAVRGDHERAGRFLEEALALWRELGDKHRIARSLNNLGGLAYQQGEYRTARCWYEEALALWREVGDQRGIANQVISLGVLARQEGDYQQAAQLCEGALALFEERGDQEGIALASMVLGAVAHNRGDTERAQALLKESLIVFSELGDKSNIAECLELLAGLASAQGQPIRAARLCGSAQALIESIGLTPAPADRYQYERNVAAVRASLGEAAFAAAWAEGRAMPLEQAIASALAGEDAASTRSLPGTSSITRCKFSIRT